MNNPELNLLVLRSADLEASVGFYGLLGFSFNEEKHERGPAHYSAEIGSLVLEIYPLGKRTPTADVRLGFAVDNLSEVIDMLDPESLVDARQRENDMVVIIKDPDGHTIELTEL